MKFGSFSNVGPPNTPHEIKQWRRSTMDMFRYLGQPVVHKHRYSPEDELKGVARKCPACWVSEYGNVRQDCPVCFGVGFVSEEDHPVKYIDDRGRLTEIATDVPAPLYGGFGEGVITWVAEPDVKFDVFRITEEGIFQRIANATAVTPWFPDMSDNDLLINIELGRDGHTIQDVGDRYELKMAQPLSIRGWGVRAQGRHEHKVQHSFQMSLLPRTHHFYEVPLDGL